MNSGVMLFCTNSMTAPLIPPEAVKNGETNFQVAGLSDKILKLLHFWCYFLCLIQVYKSLQLLI